MDRYEEEEIDPVFRTVVSHWMTKIQHATKHKKTVFQDAANECQRFFDGPKNWEDLMAGEGGMDCKDDTVGTTFQVSVNKTFEFVTIFGPAMYYENPVRTVKPRMPVIVPPQFFGPAGGLMYQSILQEENLRVQTEGLTSVLLESYLNWTPTEFNLDEEARQSIDEALIKGRGIACTELYSPPGTDMKVVRTYFESVNNLLVDPDASSFKKAQWIAIKCVHPVWQVERDYGLRRGSIKANLESQAKQADVDGDEDQRFDRLRGNTNDLLIYYKIYSKMGIGGRLQGIKKELRGPLEMFGDYAYIVVAEGCTYPLNLSPDVTNDPNIDPQAVFAKIAWPTPYWGCDEWPVTELDFHRVANSAWPMPHLKAGMGELKFLNWVMSFLMGKIRNTTRDFIAVRKDAGEEIKRVILEGRDLSILEIEASNPGTISDLIQFLQHPAVNGDVWKMISEVEANFDKRVGLTELMYGQQGQTQIRSAQEATLRNQNMNVRPTDMRKCVSAWMARVARKEAICARYHLLAKDVQPVLGGMGAWAWTQFVTTRDVNKACRQLEYRIEAGSMERPNKEWEQSTMNTAFTALTPVLQTYAQQTADMVPLNNLLGDFAKSMDLDPARYQLRSPMPPPMPPGAPGEDPGQSGGSGHQSQATSNVPPPG